MTKNNDKKIRTVTSKAKERLFTQTPSGINHIVAKNKWNRANRKDSDPYIVYEKNRSVLTDRESLKQYGLYTATHLADEGFIKTWVFKKNQLGRLFNITDRNVLYMINKGLLPPPIFQTPFLLKYKSTEKNKVYSWQYVYTLDEVVIINKFLKQAYSRQSRLSWNNPELGFIKAQISTYRKAIRKQLYEQDQKPIE